MPRKKKTTHAKTPNASRGRRSALPPNPPPAFFLFKVASSHCHIASKNITKKNHKKKKKKTKMTKENNTCKDTQCIWGGGAAPSPPTPLQPFSSLRLPPLTATLLPRTSRRKNTRRRRRQKCREKKNNTCKDTQCIWGEAQRPPPQAPSSLLFV